MSIENVQVKDGSRRLWAICRAAERAEIARVLEENRQNRTHAAMALGISRRTLLNKIKQYGLTAQVCRELVVQLPPIMPVLEVAAN
jgi:DNA-binding NtrC family response regulator